MTVTNSNPDANGFKESWEGKGGNATSDNVFCLSYEEALDYFSSNGAWKCTSTAYATAQGVGTFDTGRCYWWLRSPGRSHIGAMNVGTDGSLGSIYVDIGGSLNYSDVSYGHTGVRPALWISTKCQRHFS